jgi:hypothetical protein
MGVKEGNWKVGGTSSGSSFGFGVFHNFRHSTSKPAHAAGEVETSFGWFIYHLKTVATLTMLLYIAMVTSIWLTTQSEAPSIPFS